MGPAGTRGTKDGERKKGSWEENAAWKHGVNVAGAWEDGSRQPSTFSSYPSDIGWPKGGDLTTRSKTPAWKLDQNDGTADRELPANAGAKKAAALAAWAAFPTQAVKEDKADALTYQHSAPGSIFKVAPTIKETFKKVVVSEDKFERKIVEKSVEIVE